ncbi:hypothetical protein [Pendulispora albinea]|uniref:ABC transporter permease n=1 Tax=Pendulispora albinea TaxID=2741071 RepID=A0ABZ2LV04_9BACT
MILARVPLARFTNAPRAWLSIALWSAFAIVSALAARQPGGGSGADRILLGAFGNVVAPLLAFAAVGSALGGEGLKEAIRPVVALGASPSRVALATVLTAMGVSAAVTGLVGGAAVAIAGSPHLGADLVASLWIGALGGACYAAWFSLGATFGRGGGGRATFLVLDFLLGSSAGDTSSTIALFTPRGNLHNLLGGVAPDDVPQQVSSVALALLGGACLLLAARRANAASAKR